MTSEIETTLYVSPSGSDQNAGTSTAAPFLTIQHAVNLAETTYLPQGPVVIIIAAGTYAEQITITYAAPNALTLVGSSDPAAPTVIRPASLTANLTEDYTGYFFDDNVGQTAAIVGVQDSGGSVTLMYLTVSGASLTTAGLATGQWSGIAYINSSGTLANNRVQSIEVPDAIGQASVHGMEIKATAGMQTVAIVNNQLSQYAGHVAVDLMAGGLTPGVLTVVVEENLLVGDPAQTLTPVAQFGIAAGGLTGLTIRRNNIALFSSPWNVSGTWLDPHAPEAQWTAEYNSLVANDNGISLHGASGGVVAHNSILAGSAGMELGPQFNVPSGQTPAASSQNVIWANTIVGTTTVATTSVTVNGTAVVTAITGQPVDGILIWDGQQNRAVGNHVAGFVNDAYVGEDPVFINNTASWAPDTMPTYNNSGNTLAFNAWGMLAVPQASSGVTGYAVVNANNASVFVEDAQNNWWGTPAGPTASSNTFNPTNQGLPVSNGVDSWLEFVPPLALTEGFGFSPVLNLTTGVGYPWIRAALAAASPGDSIGLAFGTFVENVTVSVPQVTVASVSVAEPATIQPNLAQTPAAKVTVQADGVNLQSLIVSAPSDGAGIWVGTHPATSLTGIQIVSLQTVGGAIGILWTAGASGSVDDVAVNQFSRFGLSMGNEILGGQASQVTVTNSVVNGGDNESGAGIRWVAGAGGAALNNLVNGGNTGILLQDTAGVTIQANRIAGSATGVEITATVTGEAMNHLVIVDNLVEPVPQTPLAVARGIWIWSQVDGVTFEVVVNNNRIQGPVDGLSEGVVLGQTGVSAAIQWAGSGNTVARWGVGLAIFSDPVTMTFAYNNIIDNLTAVDNNSLSPMALPDNWWGVAEVPPNLSGNVSVAPVLSEPVM
ncbi:MAG: hypothetical protein OWU33_04885 [Firmicutes bacterium]|nr:hypothetical protein [Bacillota bacterium]